MRYEGLGPGLRGQVNLGPRLRGDGVRLTTTKPILPRSREGGSLISESPSLNKINGSPPGATLAVVRGQVNSGPRLRGQVNFGPRLRGPLGSPPARGRG
jgi:hypothetical protein